MKTTPLLSPADLRAHAERLESMDPSETLKPAAEADRWRAAAAAWEAAKRDQPTPDQTLERIVDRINAKVDALSSALAQRTQEREIFRAALDQAQIANGWRLIETAPTDEKSPLLLWTPHTMVVGTFRAGEWWILGARGMVIEATHWMPLPDSPYERTADPQGKTALADPSPSSEQEQQHVCGLSGYNGTIDPPCPACEAASKRRQP